MSSLGHRAWWAVPGHFSAPLVFYLEEDLEEYIFGEWPLPTSPTPVHSFQSFLLTSLLSAPGSDPSAGGLPVFP
jgi:hypothetical protein